MLFGSLIIPGKCPAAEGAPRGGMMTEQEVAAEKFFSNLKPLLKIFRLPQAAYDRVAIFEFTDDAEMSKSSEQPINHQRLYLNPI
jgi:hypothetical protein